MYSHAEASGLVRTFLKRLMLYWRPYLKYCNHRHDTISSANNNPSNSPPDCHLKSSKRQNG